MLFGYFEGYLEGFVNIYKDVVVIICGDLSYVVWVFGLVDGLLGMVFIVVCKVLVK